MVDYDVISVADEQVDGQTRQCIHVSKRDCEHESARHCSNLF